MIGYGTQFIAFLMLYSIFALASLAAWSVLRRVFKDSINLVLAAVSSLVIGPIVWGLVLWIMLFVFPNRMWSLYLGTSVLVLLIPLVFTARSMVKDARLLGLKTLIVMRNHPKPVFFCALSLLYLFFIMGSSLLLLPLHGNDPLEYMQIGRLFYETVSARVYPTLDTEISKGFLAYLSHPPTYALLITAAMLFQGSAEVAGAAKLISLWFSFATAIMCGALVYAALRRTSWIVFLAPAFCLTLPISFELTISAHIDPFRIAGFTMAMLLVMAAIREAGIRTAVVAGAGCGLSMLTHSIGILTLPIALPLMVLCARGTPRQVIMRTACVLFVALLVAGPHYLRNTLVLGSPVQDSVPTWEIPALRIAEFIGVSRGLQTLPDRLWHGVAMLITRATTFGMLPLMALIFGGALLLRALRQRFWQTCQLWFSERDSNIIIPMTLLVLGFHALLLLSALAGSDLAVKNARYVLTSAPFVAVLGLLALYHLIHDEYKTWLVSKIWLALTVSWKLLKFWKKYDRSNFAFSFSSTNPAKIAATTTALLLLILVAFDQATKTAKMVAANFLYYNITSDSLLDPESMKRAVSRSPDADVEAMASEMIGVSEKALIFRQSTYGFYKASRFQFHLDPALTPLFKLTDRNALAEGLKKQDLNWIFTPSYPLPEIQNSAFSALLADPTLVRPVISKGGWTLYAVSKTASAPSLITLMKAEPFVTANSSAFAHTESGGGMVNGRNASLHLDPGKGYAELTRRRDLFANLSRWDVITSQPLLTRVSPERLSRTDFTFSDKETSLLITGELSGSGLAEMIVEYTPDSSHAAPTFDDHVKPSQVKGYVREVIWSGLLSEKPQNVSGWLLPMPDVGKTLRADRMRSARIMFRLRDGNTLRVHGWRAEGVNFNDTRHQETARMFDLFSKGWLYEASHSEADVSRFVRSSAKSDSPLLTAFKPSSHSVRIYSPKLAIPLDFLDRIIGNRSEQNISAFISAKRLGLTLKTEVGGSSGMAVGVAITCASTPVTKEKVEGFGSLFRSTTPFPLDLQTIFLPGKVIYNEDRVVFEERIPLTCIPATLRVVYELNTIKELTTEERTRNPKLSRTGLVNIHTFSVHPWFQGTDGRVTGAAMLPAEQ